MLLKDESFVVRINRARGVSIRPENASLNAVGLGERLDKVALVRARVCAGTVNGCPLLTPQLFEEGDSLVNQLQRSRQIAFVARIACAILKAECLFYLLLHHVLLPFSPACRLT